MRNVRQVGAFLLIGIVCVTLAGCGFHLRGSAATTLPFQTAHVSGGEGDPQLVDRLRQALIESNVRVVDDGAQAQVTVKVGRVRQHKRVMSVGTDGKILEYELRYYFEYTPLDSAGTQLRPPQRIELSNDLRYDENALLAKGAEEEILYNDLRANAVSRVLFQLQSLTGVATQ